MAMTLTQLEKYMILGVENLHIKIDAFVDMFQTQFQVMQNTLERILRKLDSIDTVLENHEERISNLKPADAQ